MNVTMYFPLCEKSVYKNNLQLCLTDYHPHIFFLFSGSCRQNHRNRMREYLVSWMSLTVNKQTWYTKVIMKNVQKSRQKQFFKKMKYCRCWREPFLALLNFKSINQAPSFMTAAVMGRNSF